MYRPKVWAYVKSMGGAPVDISPYIVKGNVERLVNEVSTAEITIRNPDFKFTEAGNQTFHPMDPITIFMARNMSRPVRVFTGFLDGTPHLQLFPGTVTLRASCTIKRIKHTYWDPALPFTGYFMKKFGWQSNYDGTITNLPAESKMLETNMDAEGIESLDKDAKLNDSGLSNLLVAVMQSAGNWHPDDMLVEPLPSSLTKQIEQLWLGLKEERKETEEALREYLQKAIGDPPQEVAGGTSQVYDGVAAGDGAGLTQVQAGEKYTNSERGSFKIPAEHAPNLVWWNQGKIAIAKWMAPQLVWAKDNGWNGVLTNGFRTYAHQKAIWDSGVRPAARPGESMHEGSTLPRGAIDAGNARQLRDVLKRYHGQGPKLIWAEDVGFNDPPHLSSTGH